MPTLYNPDIMEKGEPEKAIRIFLNKPKEVRKAKTVYRKHTYPQEQWTLHRWRKPEGNASRLEAVQEPSSWR